MKTKNEKMKNIKKIKKNLDHRKYKKFKKHKKSKNQKICQKIKNKSKKKNLNPEDRTPPFRRLTCYSSWEVSLESGSATAHALRDVVFAKSTRDMATLAYRVYRQSRTLLKVQDRPKVYKTDIIIIIFVFSPRNFGFRGLGREERGGREREREKERERGGEGGNWLLNILDGQRATNLWGGSEVSLDGHLCS